LRLRDAGRGWRKETDQYQHRFAAGVDASFADPCMPRDQGLIQLSNKATVPKPPSAQILTIARAPVDLAASSFTA